ncbi:MAG: OsmC family protein [Nitrospirae bacterium]|nr:OsmC family protein [Nitrospirota bacterium]
MKINNVNVTRLEQIVGEVQKDLSKAKRVNRIEGRWNSGEGPQFSAEVQYENGKITLEADQPSFLGGGGTRPGPVIYCLYGLASCYAATFATMAAMEKVTIRRLKVTAENNIDFSRVFGLSENPVVDEVRITLHVDADAPREKVAQIEKLAYERCPAVYCLTQPIRLTTHLQFDEGR